MLTQQLASGGASGADDVPDLCSGPLDRATGGGIEGMTLHGGAVNAVFTGEIKDQSQLYGLSTGSVISASSSSACNRKPQPVG